MRRWGRSARGLWPVNANANDRVSSAGEKLRGRRGQRGEVEEGTVALRWGGRGGGACMKTGSLCSLLQRQSRTWVWRVYKDREHWGVGGFALVSAGPRRDREVWGFCLSGKKGEREEHEYNVPGGEAKKKRIEHDRPGKEEGGACHWIKKEEQGSRAGRKSTLLRGARKRVVAANKGWRYWESKFLQTFTLNENFLEKDSHFVLLIHPQKLVWNLQLWHFLFIY